MSERQKILILSLLIMTCVAFLVGAVALAVLYSAAFEQQRERLVETVQSRARLIEEVARFDAARSAADIPGGSEAATLSQVVRAHARFNGLGDTGEFTLARREGDQIVFLLRQRHADLDNPRPVPFDSDLAEPMRRALSGESGTVTGLDYRGEQVLAAYEPIGVVNWGVVGKIDLAEIRAVFIRAGAAALCVGLVVISVGAFLLLRQAGPLIMRLESNEAQTRAILETATDAVITISEEGAIESFNSAAEQIFGFAASELVGRNVSALMPERYRETHEEDLAALLRSGDPRVIGRTFILEGQCADGTTVPLEASVSEVRLHGRRTFTGVFRDVTERKRAEEELREAEQRYRTLFDQLPDAVVLIDTETTMPIAFNDLAPGLLGYSREEFAKLRISDYEARESSEDITAHRDTVVQKGGDEFETKMRTKQGEVIEVLVSIRVLELSGRTVFHNIFRDITERKRAEEELRKSEARLADAQRVARMGTWEWDIVTNDLYWSDEIYRIFGIDPEGYEATYDAFLDSVHPDDREFVQERVDAAVHDSAEYSIDHRIVLSTGEVRYVHEQGGVTRDSTGTSIRMVGTVIDITERKRAEEAHRLDDTRLEALVQLNDMADAPFKQLVDFALEEAIKVTKSTMGFVGFMNDDESVLTIHAWSKDAMRECAVTEKSMVFSIAEAGLWGEVIRQRKPIVVNDYHGLTEWKKGYPQGHVHVSRFMSIPVFDGERIVAVAAVGNKEREYRGGDVRQLTLLMDGMWRLVERQRAQEALQNSQCFLQTIIDDIPELLMVIDREHRIVLANRAVRELIGGQDPVAGCMTCFQVFHHRDRPCEDEDRPCPLNQVLSTKAPAAVTHTHLDADGNELLMEIFAAPIFDGVGEVVQVIEVCRDITDRVRAEEEARRRQAELAHVSRLGTMGEMASGLAHELNQPLSAIVNYVQACLERIRAGVASQDDLAEDMERASVQAERAGEIIEHMRNFLRKRESKRIVTDFNALVSDAASLVRPEARQNEVQVRLELADSLPPVEAESIQIQQVIVNLIRNGLEAMADAGDGARDLTISTSLSASRSVECVVQDAGPGLSAEVVERMFDQFYTTKPEGMGMGLSISRSIIESHGGRLWAEPGSEGGTRFLFTLPIVDGERAHDS